MKRICIISALMLMLFTALSGVVQTTDGKDVLAYWSFNPGKPSRTPNANDELNADEGNGAIRCSFPISDMVGTDINLLTSYDKGMAVGFVKPSAKDPYIFEKDIVVKFSTNYYKDITVSYALFATISTSGTNHTLYYSLDDGDFIEFVKPYLPMSNGEWNLQSHEIPAVNDNSDVKIKIGMKIWGYEIGHTRFDNFLITGTPMYDFIPHRPGTIDNTTITFEKGAANNITSTAVFPALPSSSMGGGIKSLALDLKDEGPWQLKLDDSKDYCAYNYGGAWVEVNKSVNGFEIEIERPELRTGNELFVVFLDEQPTLPIELTAFNVSAYPGSFPKISWETASETALNCYYILRGESPYLHSAQVISPLIPANNSSYYMRYEYEDKSAVSDARYYYWLHILELNQVDSYAGPIALEYHAEEIHPAEYSYTITGIKNIYPNPFNPSTNISFELADDTEVGFKMYNLRGEEVLRLESSPYPKGVHHISIDSNTHIGRELPAGVYLLKMQAGTKSYLRKMTLLK